jgi:hypothetical protein
LDSGAVIASHATSASSTKNNTHVIGLASLRSRRRRLIGALSSASSAKGKGATAKSCWDEWEGG